MRHPSPSIATRLFRRSLVFFGTAVFVLAGAAQVSAQGVPPPPPPPPTGSTPATTCTGFTYSAWSACTNGTQTRTVLTRTPSGCTGGSPVTSQSCTGGTTGGSTTGTPPAPTTTPGSTGGTGGTTPPPPTTTPGGSTKTYTLADVIKVIQNWLGAPTAETDINQDGKVNTRDLGIMLSRWVGSTGGGTTPPPPTTTPGGTGGSTGGTTPPPPSTPPGGTGSTTCTGFTYSGWGTCSNGTQTRTVLTRTPSGCTGGSPVTSQSCTGGTGTVPPPPPPPPIGG